MDKKPSFPPRMAGWEYQYKRAEAAQADADRRRELLKEALKVLAEVDPGWPIVEPVYTKIKKELADD